MGYCFWFAAHILLYMQNPTDRIIHTTAFAKYTSSGALAGMRNSSMGERFYHGATSRSWVHHEELIQRSIASWANALTTELHLAPGPTMKNWSDDPLHHERTLLPLSYISLLGSPWRINPTTHCTMSERSYHWATSRSWVHHEGSIRRPIAPWANTLTTVIVYVETWTDTPCLSVTQ